MSPTADLLQTKQAFELINSGLLISFIAAATKQEASSALTLGSFSSALFRMQHKMFGGSLGKVDRELSWLPKHLRPPQKGCWGDSTSTEHMGRMAYIYFGC